MNLAKIAVFVFIAVMMISWKGLAEDSTILGWASSQTAPDTNRVEKLKREFLSLKRPIAVGTFVEKTSTSLAFGNSIAYVTIGGDGKNFLEKSTVEELTYALWPFFEDDKYDADATLMLLCKLHVRISATYELTQDSQSVKRFWPTERKGMIRLCKRSCQFALGEPDWWYPHLVLFDREKVLAECNDNPVARASYIAAMQKALANPNIRTENPLGVDETLGVLSALHAVEAAPTYVSYLLFDRTTGGDFRLATTNAMQLVDKTDSLPFENCLPQLKLKVAPLVLARIANATHDEMSCEIGGGGLPLLSINYFWLMHIREAQAVECVEAFIRAHQDYAEQQIANLDTILDAIKTKKYRPFFMNGSDWSAPVAANAPPTKP